MKQLLTKEIRLVTHPTNYIFWLLSALLLIPNYPYYVTFFYTAMGIFFMCLNARENHDIEYTLLLPIQKAQVVRARVMFILLIEIIQFLLAVPFAILRAGITPAQNEVGMDANLSFFGLSLIMMGLFNYLFITIYYRDPAKVGKAFIISSSAIFLYICIAEALTHALPFFRDQLDTPDPQYLTVKLILLAVGVLVFFFSTFAAERRAEKSFVTLDL